MTDLAEFNGSVKIINPILEIKATSLYHLRLICSPDRGVSVKKVIENQSFDGVDILWASVPFVPEPRNICVIPHFDHDISCDGPCHGGGVYRLFEFQCIVPEDASVISQRWEIGDWIQIAVTHSGRPATDKELEQATSETPQIGRLSRECGPDEPYSGKEERLYEQQAGMGLGAKRGYQNTFSSR